MPRDDEVDLLVFGAGAGGMAAAIAAARMGLSVLVCEKSDQVGGTTATSAGTLWVPANSQSRRAGFTDSRTAAAQYLGVLLPDGRGQALQQAYLERAPDVIDWFAAHSQLRFLPCGKHPDYQDLPGAAVAGRAIVPAPFDGRLLGRQFRRVRAPIPEFMVLGGMMVGKEDVPRLLGRFDTLQNFAHAGRLFARYAADRLRHPRGTRLVMGNALVGRLYHSLLQSAVPVRFDARLESLVQRDGRVAGARVEIGGVSSFVAARRGVVLATGGYGRHAAMRKAFMPRPTPAHSLAAPGVEGDGIAAGLAVGGFSAHGQHGTGAFWAPASRTGSGRWAGLYPHLAMDRAKPGLIAVNASGMRFANEAVSYHHFVEAMFATHASAPAIPAWLVCETGFVRKYGLGAIHPRSTDLRPFERSGTITVAGSLAALAARIGVDAAGLQQSVERNNAFAATGIDADFGKGTTELNRFNGDASHGPNPCLGPIGAGPYCAVAVWPAEIACSTGLETDASARVLDAGGRPIAGLYACGNDLASVMRGTYPGPGTTLGPALVFGYLAAEHAAGRC